jgi:hypothetical protein
MLSLIGSSYYSGNNKDRDSLNKEDNCLIDTENTLLNILLNRLADKEEHYNFNNLFLISGIFIYCILVLFTN